MNPCNYAWNIGSLALGISTEMEFNRYRGTEFSKTEDTLEIVGSVPGCYGHDQIEFGVSGFAEQLSLIYAGFYACAENLNTIAGIVFYHSGGFGFKLYFKWG